MAIAKASSSPQAASICRLPVPGGLPFRLPEPSVEAKQVESDRAIVPSGPYFLGLPLFFFSKSFSPPFLSPPVTFTVMPNAGITGDGNAGAGKVTTGTAVSTLDCTCSISIAYKSREK